MRLVTTLLAPDLEALARLSARAPTGWVEVRLDALAGIDPEMVREARRRVRQRAIATCRPRGEGGRFQGSEAAREAVLRAALRAGFEALDVECDARFARKLAHEAQRAGAELVVSRHDLNAASAAHGLESFLAKVPPDGIAKYAAGVEGPEDLAALVRACALAREHGVRYAVMGLGDASLRLLAPLLGCELVYCAHPEGEAAAPGQLPAPAVQAVHDLLPAPVRITARHRLVVLLGDPVEHSLSPAMQNAAFAARGDALLYAAVRAPRARLRAILEGLRQGGFAGANVTSPLKESALPLMDGLDRSAARARSVNTITARGGRLKGHSTDGEGAVAALHEAGVGLDGAPVLVLGAGATGRAVAHALADAGARLRVANRTAARGKALAREVGGEAVPWTRARLGDAAAQARVVVHCTTLGRSGRGSPLAPAMLHEKLAVLDAVYRPGHTPLVRAARARGCVALSGEALLLHQGARSYRLWTGHEAPLAAMRAALRAHEVA